MLSFGLSIAIVEKGDEYPVKRFKNKEGLFFIFMYLIMEFLWS